MCILYIVYVHFFLPFFHLLSPFTIDKSADDKQIWFLFLVFIGVYLPELAMKEESQFIPSFEGKHLWRCFLFYYVPTFILFFSPC